MKSRRQEHRQARWARQDAAWRDPAEAASLWEQAGRTDPGLLRHTVRGAWWEILAESGLVLLIAREYEHLLVALAASASGPRVSYWPLPHPSGLAFDVQRGIVHVASTRNPNQVFDFAPVSPLLPRKDGEGGARSGGPLIPRRARFYPGCLYLHDLAMVQGSLHAAAVGQNAVVRLDPAGGHERVWWPRSIESPSGPLFERNHLQLNSIAAGKDIASSYFSASAESVSARRPGHRNFPVDRRGVIFSGKTREPVVRGLTRPHSARLRRGKIWVNNSGYGEVGFVERGRWTSLARLPGWTRGLAFHRETAFVGTSRVIPRFSNYAPGLDERRSVCGVHAIDVRTGRLLGSLLWPDGNQIFAVEPVPATFASGFALPAGARGSPGSTRKLFYSFIADIRP